MNIVQIQGSGGLLFVDRASGVIVDRERWDDGYDHIALVDVISIEHALLGLDYSEMDINEAGYITTDGTYVPALSFELQIHSRDYPDGHGNPMWDVRKLLPAPKAFS